MQKRLVVAFAIVLLGLGLARPAMAQQAPQTPAPTQPVQGAPSSTTPAPAPAAQPAPGAQPAPAAQPEPPVALPAEVTDLVQNLSKSIETAEKSIQQLKELEGELSRLRADVERIIYDSTSTAESLRPQLAEVKSQIEKLGPPPAKDQPPESPTVAAERARLNAMAAALDGAVKTSELAWVRAKQLIDRITVIRYQMFTRNLLEKRDSPLLPGVWRDVASRMDSVVGRLKYYGGDWLTWAGRRSTEVTALGIAIAVLYLLGRLGVRRLVVRHWQRPEKSPSFFDRTIKASWLAPAKMLPGVVVALLAYLGLSGLDLLFSPWEGVANATARSIMVFCAATSLLAVALAPAYPAWRLIPVADGTARKLLWILTGFVGVYVLDTVLSELGRAIYVPLAITVAQTFLTSLLFFALLVALLLSPFVPQTGPDRPVNGHEFVPRPVTRLSPIWIKLPLWLIAGVILVSSALGYVALGRFVSHQLVLSGMVLGAAGLLYLAVRAMTRGRADSRDMVGNVLETRFGLEGSRRHQISRLTEFTLSLLIGLLALPLLLLQWGFSGADIRDWSKAMLFGFEIGQFRISLFRILIGIGLFTALLFVTRLVQRWLRDRVLAQGRVDAGIANSIDTAVGYAGTALALLLAVSYAGFDITSLAIVAGALSVGIGFGLQSIVNNFVSGLILLVERPVKVGDWIVVGNEQGNVRRISVRSTEIETFDRASLIIPNSELITGRVLNWTHRNNMGRTIIKVTVDPNSDPERVLRILRACAEAHPEVLKTPPPSVAFEGFSSQSLDFIVRVVLSDVYRSGAVATDLRVAILKILREEGLGYQNQQHDVHLRDLDGVRSLLQRIAAQRASEATTANDHAATPQPGAESFKKTDLVKS